MTVFFLLHAAIGYDIYKNIKACDSGKSEHK